MKNESISVADMVARDVDLIHFSMLNSEMLFPERLIVEVGVSKIDIGCLCYSVRESIAADGPSKPNNIKRVDISSFREERRELVKRFVDHLVVGAYRGETIYEKCSSLMSLLNWIDLNGFSDFLLSPELARKFYKAYFEYLKNRVLTNDNLIPRSAATKQRFAQSCIRLAFGQDEASYVVRKIPSLHNRAGRVQESPEEERVREYINVLMVLSKQLSIQLIQEKPMPFSLQFREFDCYVFPGRGRNVKTPFVSDVVDGYNFDNGCIATADELMGKAPGLTRGEANIRVREFARSLEKSNRKGSDARMRYTTLALQSYAVLFQLITAANPSQLIDLEFDEAFEVASSVKKELSAVKFRAGGREVFYTVGKIGVRLLKEYLAFRLWALGGAYFKYLFFEYERGGSYTTTPKSLSYDFQHSFFHRRLKGIYLPENFKNITASQARLFKSVVLHELGVNPKIVAESLQHTTRVNNKSYVNVNAKVAKREFGNYWAAVEAAAKNYRIVESNAENITSIASGECDDFGNPAPVSNTIPIQPDCDKQYGCMYCKHYCCHADEEDVHKLLSLKYVLSEVRQSARNINDADDVLRELCVRASFVVDSIRSISEAHHDMVKKMEKKVFELGILTSFWEIRLSRYERLGVVL